MGVPPKSNSSSTSSMPSGGLGDVLLLDATTVRQVLTPARALAALKRAYIGLHANPNDAGRSLGFQAIDGKLHVKAGLSPGRRDFFAAKVNANFPMNAVRSGLPTIQGLVLLVSGTDGRPLAVLDSGELTSVRTAAATALAASHGANRDARHLGIVGCGAQARHQALALTAIRSIDRITVFDTDTARTASFTEWAGDALNINAEAMLSIADAVTGADMVVTCTTATVAIITPEMIAPGCFVAAVGADNPDKQEIAVDLFSGCRIIVDDLEQCATGGDLAHAIREGAVHRESVTANLAELAAGAVKVRTSPADIVLFDSTGTGIQDVAAAVATYDAAREAGLGRSFSFAS